MSLDVVSAPLAMLLVAHLVALAFAIADRHARAAAWRRIADERRWNHERLSRRAVGQEHVRSACPHGPDS